MQALASGFLGLYYLSSFLPWYLYLLRRLLLVEQLCHEFPSLSMCSIIGLLNGILDTGPYSIMTADTLPDTLVLGASH